MKKFVINEEYPEGSELELDKFELEEFKNSRILFEEKIKNKLYKSTFIRRMTKGEASVFYDTLNSEEPYVKLLFDATDSFLINDALFGYLHFVLSSEFGEERAVELMEPEE